MNNKKNSSAEKSKIEKEMNLDSRKITKILVAVFGELAKKLSVGLVLNLKKQVDDVILRIKRGILAGFFTIFGIFFLLIGFSIYLNSVCDFVPGGGFLVIGGSSILLAALIALLKK